MLAKDIMTTQVITIRPDTTVQEAIKTLIQIEISGLIVTDEQGDIVGVVTERDMLIAFEFVQQTQVPVENYMNRKIISVTEDTTIEEVGKMLIHGDVRRVPVLRGKKVVGVISRRDLLKNILKHDHKKSKS